MLAFGISTGVCVKIYSYGIYGMYGLYGLYGIYGLYARICRICRIYRVKIYVKNSAKYIAKYF